MRALGVIALAVLGPTACNKSSPDPAASAATSSAGTANAAIVAPPPVSRSIDAIAGLDQCTLGHRGVLLDMGDASTRARVGSRLDADAVEPVEHEGATWARVHSRALSASFYWSGEIDRPPAPAANGGDASAPADSGVYVEARIRAVTARSATVYVNGKIVGSWSLSKGETRVVIARGGSATLAPGPNELVVRFVGGAGVRARANDVLAEVDWIHVGAGDAGEPYAAPTRSDALTSATLGGVSRRALSLRAPGFVRCVGWIPKGGIVEGTLGLLGEGDADVQVRVLRDRQAPSVLGTQHVSGGSQATWGAFSMPISEAQGGAPGAVELVATRASKGARVLFGEPRVAPSAASSSPAASMPKGRNVVLVVMSGLAPRTLALEGGPRPTPELSALAASGITFEAHRAPTPLAAGAMASMMTGLLPSAHALEDPDAKLPKDLTTIADAARQAGVSTAMFTANPATGPAFGFDRGWDKYVAHAPTDDGVAATSVFDEAAQWIELRQDQRFLLVVHARGGHPPWDATPEDLKSMAPPNYTGGLDAKHAAEILTRSKKSGRFSDADRARAWALYALAVDNHDVALGRLLLALRSSGHDADTTVMVTGDVSESEAAAVPFVDGEALDENVLGTLLVVRAVDRSLAGRRVSAPTASVDVARSVMAALGLEAPAGFRGMDVYRVASEDPSAGERPELATSANRFAARWGTFVLFGTRERESKLCDLSLDRACVTDVRGAYPLSLEALHGFVFDAFEGPDAKRTTPAMREPAFLDSHTAGALRAWGRPQDKHEKEL